MLTIDTIKKRISCRTYQVGPMKESDQQKLRDFLLANVRGPFGNRVRFELVDLAAQERDEIKTLGTYGFIKGAGMFIVGAVAKDPRAMKDYGYCMEKNILAATHLGLGTCWLGVHPREQRIAALRKILALPESILPVACIALGRAAEQKEPRTRYNAAFVHWETW